MLKNIFYFILKVLFVLRVLIFLCWLFGHVEKIAWLERYVYQNLWRDRLLNKRLRYTYYALSQDVKGTRKRNLVRCNKKSISLQKSSRKWCSKTSSKSLFLKKEFYKVKANFLQLSFNMFWWSFTWHTIKARCVKT